MQRQLTTTLATALLLCTGASLAQETDTDLYDGQWNVRMQAADGSVKSARLVVANFAGSWQDLPGKTAKNQAVNKACAGKKFPITVQRSLPERMEFMVWGSSVAPSCPDLSVMLRPTNPKTLEGMVDETVTIKMVRR